MADKAVNKCSFFEDQKKEFTMRSHGTRDRILDHFEISTRFRHIIEDRIARLEADAALDEATLIRLENQEHIRRQLRLVAVQREEACCMRNFLEHSSTRIQPR